jgi:LEA14-like dessication related protein
LVSGVKSLAYNLSLANVPIGEASLGQSTTISANDSGLVQLPISFRPMDFGGALWDIVCGRGTGYDMTGNLEVDTPFGPMHLPFNKSSETTLKKKGDDEDKVCSSFVPNFSGTQTLF